MAQEQPRTASADHLKPYRWAKGQSGNPGGRPSGVELKRRAQGRALRGMADGRQVVDVLLQIIEIEALQKRQPWAIREYLRLIDAGKDEQAVQSIADLMRRVDEDDARGSRSTG